MRPRPTVRQMSRARPTVRQMSVHALAALTWFGMTDGILHESLHNCYNLLSIALFGMEAVRMWIALPPEQWANALKILPCIQAQMDGQSNKLDEISYVLSQYLEQQQQQQQETDDNRRALLNHQLMNLKQNCGVHGFFRRRVGRFASSPIQASLIRSCPSSPSMCR